MVLLAPRLMGVSTLDAAVMGAVVGAVSPAVLVPRMLRLLEEGYGAEKGIPQMILAGASVDDVFVIVLFSSFTGMAQGGARGPPPCWAPRSPSCSPRRWVPWPSTTPAAVCCGGRGPNIKPCAPPFGGARFYSASQHRP